MRQTFETISSPTLTDTAIVGQTVAGATAQLRSDLTKELAAVGSQVVVGRQVLQDVRAQAVSKADEASSQSFVVCEAVGQVYT